MTIDEKSWHCRIYLWWYRNKYGFPNENRVSNLCPYMRVVMFWAPLRSIFGTWIKIGKVPVNAITLPSFFLGLPFLLGYIDYSAKMVLFSTYLVIAAVAVLVTFGCCIAYLFSKDGKNIAGPLVAQVKNSDFADLVHEYFRSAHDRVCPEVSWK